MAATRTSRFPMACNISALSPEERNRREELSAALHALVEERRSLDNGFALRLQTQADTLQQIAQFIHFEQICCPFIHFEVEVPANQGPTWVRMTGGEGVKEFLASTFDL